MLSAKNDETGRGELKRNYSLASNLYTFLTGLIYFSVFPCTYIKDSKILSETGRMNTVKKKRICENKGLEENLEDLGLVWYYFQKIRV